MIFIKILYSASLQNFVQLRTIPGVLYYSWSIVLFLEYCTIPGVFTVPGVLYYSWSIVLFLEYCTVPGVLYYRSFALEGPRHFYLRKEFVVWRPAFPFVLRCYKTVRGVAIQCLKF